MAWKTAFAIVTLALAPAALATTAVLPPDAVLVETESWKPSDATSRSDAAAVLARVANADPAAATDLMQGWHDPARFELAAAIVIQELQNAPETPAARALLEALSKEPIRLYRRHEETAADWFVPLFDIAGRAASALKLFDDLRRRDALADALRRDPTQAIRQSKDAALLAAAIGSLDSAASSRVVSLAIVEGTALPSAAWVALARRSPSPELLDKVAEFAHPVDVLPLMAELTPNLPLDQATNWLARLVANPELASAGLLELGVVAAKHAPAEAILARHLGNPHTGASAAAALARMQRPDRLDRIDALLAEAKTAEAVRDIALALRLEGSAPARERLERLVEDPRLPADAKAELQP